MTKEQREQRITALTRLALATREKLDPASYVLYVEDTARYSTAVVVEACRRLETSASWFPKLAELTAECRLVAERQQEAAEARQRKRLPPAPVPQEKLDHFLAQMRDVIQKKTMK